MAVHQKGRLKSQPLARQRSELTVTGLRRTGIDAERDGYLYIPQSTDFDRPAPLLVMLHGAGGNGHHSIDPIRELADRTGTIILAPESQGNTWDVILGGYGIDVASIDEALRDVFAKYSVDTKRLAIAGFSDGASYALSLGLTNGDLFSHVIAFSPGFAAPSEIRGTPRIYISHGATDRVLPINHCSRRIVPKLRAAALDVTYQEFDAGHTIPDDIGRIAFEWYLGRAAAEEIADATVHSEDVGLEFT